MLRRIALTTLALFGCSLHALGQQRAVQRPDGSRIAASQIDESVGQLMQAAHVTGVGIALFHGGKIVYPKISIPRAHATNAPSRCFGYDLHVGHPMVVLRTTLKLWPGWTGDCRPRGPEVPLEEMWFVAPLSPRTPFPARDAPNC